MPDQFRAFKYAQPWLVIAVLCASILGFSGSIIYAERTATKLDRNAISIASNASLAIDQLSKIDRLVLELQARSIAALQQSPDNRKIDKHAFDDALTGIKEEFFKYHSIPFYPGERGHYTHASVAIAQLERETSGFLARLEGGDAHGAAKQLQTGFLPAIWQTNQAIDELIAFNTAEQRRLAQEIPLLRKNADKTGHKLIAVSSGLGIALMVGVVMAIRRSARLLDEQRLLAEARAAAIAAFSTGLQSINQATLKIANAIFDQPDLTKLFQLIADEACTIGRAEYCALGYGREPELWVYSGMYRAQTPTPPLGRSLDIPIAHHERILGRLELARKPESLPFGENEERLLKFFSSYVGVAIDNASLFLEAQLAIREREDLLAVVSHDLKNPLTAIRMAAELMETTTEAGRATELAARINGAADRMLALVNQLLDAAKIEAGLLKADRQAESITSILEEAAGAFDSAAAEKGSRLSLRIPNTPLYVACERTLLLRVFTNLIGNAIKFTPQQGAITVATERMDNQVLISISDTGPGIPPDQLPHVFDRYWQQNESDRRGSGLGLYICKGIVEAHGGKISVTSTFGEGTTFHITLPTAG